ncbi:MAG: ComF family protein [Sulfurihydrogenibium sp.]|uniref:ComF family protein n=1 Tax=Sulfurihydrogenibium sp. TaxID=2053621 RepID=UPI003C7D1966
MKPFLDFRLALNVLFPNACVVCKNPFVFDHQNLICQDCLSQMKEDILFYCHSCGKSGDNTYPVCNDCIPERKYEDIKVFTSYYKVQHAIQHLKFQKIKTLAKDLGLLIKDDIQDYIKSNKIQNVLYVPISEKVKKERGFNHLKEILRYCVPSFLVKDYIKKVRETDLQVRLNKEERFKNLKDAFSLTVDKLEGNTLVFDDVITTGATLLEIFRVLKGKVNGKVYAYAIAKG